MKISDIRSLPDEDIRNEIDKVRGKIFKLKFQAKGSGQEEAGSARRMRQDVARLLTVLREREMKLGR